MPGILFLTANHFGPAQDSAWWGLLLKTIPPNSFCNPTLCIHDHWERMLMPQRPVRGGVRTVEVRHRGAVKEGRRRISGRLGTVASGLPHPASRAGKPFRFKKVSSSPILLRILSKCFLGNLLKAASGTSGFIREIHFSDDSKCHKI